MDRLFSIEEAAAYLGGISVWTVRAWLSQRRLNPTKVGRRTMIRKSELDWRIEEDNRPAHPCNHTNSEKASESDIDPSNGAHNFAPADPQKTNERRSKGMDW